MNLSDERGLTLIEVLISMGIGIVVLVALVFGAMQFTKSAAHTNASLNAHTAVDTLSERLDSDASGAWAVYVPASDALGADNTDGHAVAFYAQDGSHQTYGWQYSFDAAAHAVTRYTYDPANVATTAKSAEVFDNVTAFDARAVTATDVTSNAQSPGYDPLFAGATVTDASFAYAQGPVGGNGIIVVTIDAAATSNTLRLASGTAPTTFTVVVNFTPSPPPPTQPPATQGPSAPPLSPTPAPTPGSTPTAPATLPPSQTPPPTQTPTPAPTPTAAAGCQAPYVVGVGQACIVANASMGYSDQSNLDCTSGGGWSGGSNDFYSFKYGLQTVATIDTAGSLSTPFGVIAYDPTADTLTFTRSAPGTVDVRLVDRQTLPTGGARGACLPVTMQHDVASYVFN